MDVILTVVILQFLAAFNVVEGKCDAYNQGLVNTQRCRQIQECIDRALISNSDNLYVLEKVFRSAQPRPPVALMVNYYIQWYKYNTIISQDSINNGELKPNENDTDFENTDGNVTEITNLTQGYTRQETSSVILTRYYIEQIGWSSTGVYTIIRPLILLSLHPAWLLWTLSFAIDSYGYPKTVNMHLFIKESDLPAKTSTYEIKEALEHLTTKLDYNATEKVAYSWNTSMDTLQSSEMVLFWIISMLVLSTLVVLLIGLPRLLKCSFNWESGGLGFELGNIVQMEIDYSFKLISAFKIALHTQIRHAILFSTLGISIVAAILTIIAGLKITRSILTSICLAVFSFIICMLTVNLVIYSLPLIMFTFIYPVEMITTISFIVVAIVGIGIGKAVLEWFVDKEYKSDSGKRSKKEKYYHKTKCVLLFICAYFVIPFAVNGLLILYLSLLNSLAESPVSQLSQLLLAFVPSISATIVGYVLTKKLGHKEKPAPASKLNDYQFNQNFIYGHYLQSKQQRSKYARSVRANWLRAFQEQQRRQRRRDRGTSNTASEADQMQPEDIV